MRSLISQNYFKQFRERLNKYQTYLDLKHKYQICLDLKHKYQTCLDLKHKYQTCLDLKHENTNTKQVWTWKKQKLNRFGTLNTKQGFGIQNVQKFATQHEYQAGVWFSEFSKVWDSN